MKISGFGPSGFDDECIVLLYFKLCWFIKHYVYLILIIPFRNLNEMVGFLVTQYILGVFPRI